MSAHHSSSPNANPTVSASESTSSSGSRRGQQKVGARSCAECRRLKLRCDRQIPCTTCTRRGCAAICPDGHLTPGQGNRFVLASTEDLHEHIQKLSYRVRSLEDGLRESHAREGEDVEHPLLAPELAAIKAPLQRSPRPTYMQLQGATSMTQPPTLSAGSSGQSDYGSFAPAAYGNLPATYYPESGPGGFSYPPHRTDVPGAQETSWNNNSTALSTEMLSTLHPHYQSGDDMPYVASLGPNHYVGSSHQPHPSTNYPPSGAGHPAYYNAPQEHLFNHPGRSTSQYTPWSHAPPDNWDGCREGHQHQ